MSDSMNQEEFQDVEIPREQQLRALTVIDKYALDFDDKVLLAQILGIAPSRGGGKCRECGHTMSGADFVDHVRPGADGYCAGCYRARLKERKAGVSS